MSSLRFRLPALFLAGMVVAALVTAIAAVTLFQDSTRADTLADLRRQAEGLAELYAAQALEPGQTLPATRLEKASGTTLYYAGLSLFTETGLRKLDISVIPDQKAFDEGLPQTFEFRPPGQTRVYLAAAHPLRIGEQTFGDIVVAKPRAELRERWVGLAKRLALSLLAGLAVAVGLVWYLSRRLTAPVVALTRATDEVSRGRYDVQLPPAHGKDEISLLTARFGAMTRRLAEAEELERNFLMSVSHELRTPLTAIRGHVGALSEGLIEDADLREASLEVIRSETDRLSRLVGDLLDLARLDAHRFQLAEEEVNLRQLVESAYNARSEDARARDIVYEQSFDANPVLYTDGDRVLQIVTNLVDNAFAWTPDGGRIGIGLTAANGTVHVTVTDSGPGIPEEDHDLIFRPFVSGDKTRGTGLGLAIARELALALGGELRLESEPGKGSRFELRLPGR
jgi:signal transduction histidine kinase